MRSYTVSEKRLMKLIVNQGSETDSFFQLFISEYFFKQGFRPFMLVDGDKGHVLLFFSQGGRHREFPKFVAIASLMEDLVSDRLIARVPMNQGIYFVGEFFDAEQRSLECGNSRFTSKSTGRYLETPDMHKLYDRNGNLVEVLDIVKFDDPAHFRFFSTAFSGVVYPREALTWLVKNGFRSSEQIRHVQAMFTAWAAIILSFFVGLF